MKVKIENTAITRGGLDDFIDMCNKMSNYETELELVNVKITAINFTDEKKLEDIDDVLSESLLTNVPVEDKLDKKESKQTI